VRDYSQIEERERDRERQRETPRDPGPAAHKH
jgi:hypothetical protein